MVLTAEYEVSHLEVTILIKQWWIRSAKEFEFCNNFIPVHTFIGSYVQVMYVNMYGSSIVNS